MERVTNVLVNAGSRNVEVEIFKLGKDDVLENLSRVYVIVFDKKMNIPLIYNSKRNIWGFPGGHIEEGESYGQAALRECTEEIKVNIENCQPRFLLINKIDDDKKERQVVCFSKKGESREDLIDKNESVTKVSYVPIKEVVSKIGNDNLWEPIIDQLMTEGY